MKTADNETTMPADSLPVLRLCSHYIASLQDRMRQVIVEVGILRTQLPKVGATAAKLCSDNPFEAPQEVVHQACASALDHAQSELIDAFACLSAIQALTVSRKPE